MPFDRQIFKKATEIIERRRFDAIRKSEEKHTQCILLFPEIAELEKEMAQTSISASNAFMKKENAKSYVEALMEKNLSAQRKIGDILKENNLPANYFEPAFSCKKCNDTGYCNSTMCDCLLDTMKKISLEEMSGKCPVKDCTFDNFDVSLYPDEIDEKTGLVCRTRMNNIFNYCKNYADDFSLTSDSLLFYGETGLGKTHLSLAIAGKVGSKGYNTVYGSAQSLINMLEDEKFGRSTLDVSAEKSILGCDLLVIDDLGAEFSTQFTISALYNILNQRLLEKKPVIISTNLTAQEMENRYSRRITSRIYGNFRYLIFCGKDIRQIKAQY